MKGPQRSPILVRWLSQQWLFSGSPMEELDPILHAARAARFLPGALIYRAGDPSDHVYLLTSGVIKVAALDHRGQQVQGRMPAPAIFGEMGALDGQPRTGAAIAVESSTAYVVPASDFRQVLAQSPAVMSRLIALLVARLRRGNGPYVELPSTAEWLRAADVEATGETIAPILSPNRESA